MTIELDRPSDGYYHITRNMVIDGHKYEIKNVPVNNMEKIHIILEEVNEGGKEKADS